MVKTKHLPFGAHLSRKLAPKWVGPFKILQEINPVAFKLELPAKFNRMHPVFYSSQLKLHSGAVEPSPAPIFDDSEVQEYEVEDLLDMRTSTRGRLQKREFLVKWLGYSVFDATWEPEANLNCPEILKAFLSRRGLS